MCLDLELRVKFLLSFAVVVSRRVPGRGSVCLLRAVQFSNPSASDLALVARSGTMEEGVS